MAIMQSLQLVLNQNFSNCCLVSTTRTIRHPADSVQIACPVRRNRFVWSSVFDTAQSPPSRTSRQSAVIKVDARSVETIPFHLGSVFGCKAGGRRPRPVARITTGMSSHHGHGGCQSSHGLTEIRVTGNYRDYQ